ncbi:hypothetical protein KUCAC02_013938, partial [Chaenocephalus aceratus]
GETGSVCGSRELLVDNTCLRPGLVAPRHILNKQRAGNDKVSQSGGPGGGGRLAPLASIILRGSSDSARAELVYPSLPDDCQCAFPIGER